MATTQNKELNQFYQTLQKLSIAELEAVMEQILALRKQKIPSVLSENETELLKKINIGLPNALQKRYQSLIKKRQAESLSEAEHTELTELTVYAETHNNQRIKHLIELARLRNISIDQLIDDLQLTPRPNVV